MGFFKKKIRITTDVFIANESNKSVTVKSADLSSLFTASNIKVLNDLEITIFSAFMPLLAMSLAKLQNNVQREYVAEVAEKLESEFGNNAGDHFQERVLEYLNSYDKDHAEGKSHLLPSTLSSALNNIVGKCDESVAICRLGLVKVIGPSLKSDVEFFKELKFV